MLKELTKHMKLPSEVAGSKFSNIRNRGNNFTWTITPAYDTDGDTAWIYSIRIRGEIIQIKLQLVL